jgi:hypothetical protein
MRLKRDEGAPGLRSLLSGVGVAMVALCLVPQAQAQKMTEQFIPIGQSPGLSQKYTSIGEITQVNPQQRTITIADPAGPRTVKITAKTHIWLDRTKLKQPNLFGKFADLQRGRRVEVKYEDAERRDVAEWVKVEITRP